MRHPSFSSCVSRWPVVQMRRPFRGRQMQLSKILIGPLDATRLRLLRLHGVSGTLRLRGVSAPGLCTAMMQCPCIGQSFSWHPHAQPRSAAVKEVAPRSDD